MNSVLLFFCLTALESLPNALRFLRFQPCESKKQRRYIFTNPDLEDYNCIYLQNLQLNGNYPLIVIVMLYLCIRLFL